MSLLRIEDLSVTYRTGRGCIQALDGVSLTLERGQSLGLVGESGSGKSTIGFAVMGLLPSNAEIVGGRVLLEGRDLSALSDRELRQMRWQKVSMIFQAAMNALNPLQRVSAQILEAIRTHAPQMPPAKARARMAELLGQVGIDPGRGADYPHQYSGGMRQRAVIAMALACRPALVIADEPTTALDVLVQAQILALLQRLQAEHGISMLLISHDISVVAEVCHHIGVLYAGQLVEVGTREEVFAAPAHPYTRALLNAHITLACDRRHPPAPIDGQGPDLARRPSGCCFGERCTAAAAGCRKAAPVWTALSPSHKVRCCQEVARP